MSTFFYPQFSMLSIKWIIKVEAVVCRSILDWKLLVGFEMPKRHINLRIVTDISDFKWFTHISHVIAVFILESLRLEERARQWRMKIKEFFSIHCFNVLSSFLLVLHTAVYLSILNKNRLEPNKCATWPQSIRPHAQSVWIVFLPLL